MERGRQLRPRQVGQEEEEARKGLGQRQQELRAGAISTQVATLTGRDEDRHAGTSMEGKLQVELAAVARVPPVRGGGESKKGPPTRPDNKSEILSRGVPYIRQTKKDVFNRDITSKTS